MMPATAWSPFAPSAEPPFALRPLPPRSDHELWQAWSELARGASPFVRPEIAALERRLVGPGEPLVAVARTGGAIAAILPLVRRGRTLAAFRSDHVPFFDFVGDPAAMPGLWAALAADRGWDELVLAGVPAASPLALELPGLALRDLCVTAVKPGPHQPYFALPGHDARLSAKLKQNNRRCARKLGALELERLTRFSHAALGELLTMEALAWKGAAGTSILASDEARHFYLALARLAARRGELSVYFLRSRGKRIAFLFALEDGRHVYGLKIGYDPAFAEFSPGHLLIAEVARDAEARGLLELHLLGHQDEWKRRWTELTRDQVSLVIYRPSLRGAATLVTRELVKPRVPPAWMARATQARTEVERYRRPCQKQDLIGAHTLVERVHDRMRGPGLRSALRRVIAGASGKPALGVPSRFAPGQWVRVRDVAAVRATLDADAKLRGLLFVPAQWQSCGQVFRVLKSVRRLVDDSGIARPVSRTVLLEGATCDLAGDELGCGRACPLMFRDEWLEPAEAPADAPPPREATAGQWATVRPLAEIEDGLDGRRKRDGVTFLDEMTRFVGRRLRVAHQLSRVFELDRWTPTRAPVYLLEGANCHGETLAGEGPCDRACALMWHADWLVLEPRAEEPDVAPEAPLELRYFEVPAAPGVTYYFAAEVAGGYVTQQLELHDDGRVLAYDELLPTDSHGGIEYAPLDLQELEPFEIEREAFEAAWQAARPDNRRG